jgi:hypothetical protein
MNLKEQKEAAKSCGKTFCCLARKPGTWEVALATDDVDSADSWWEQQTGSARVFYSSGAIRNAK